MIYRIRFCRPGQTDESEAAVEANNPTEAVVKFRHTHSTQDSPSRPAGRVTSIRPEPPKPDEPSPW